MPELARFLRNQGGWEPQNTIVRNLSSEKLFFDNGPSFLTVYLLNVWPLIQSEKKAIDHRRTVAQTMFALDNAALPLIVMT